MAKCNKCGAAMPAGKKFCTKCGAPEGRPSEGRPPQGGASAVMSTGAFVLASLIMCIPLIGLIIYIVWACGGCKNLNRRNFARAALILMAVGVVLSIVSYFVVNGIVSSLGGGGLQELLEILKQARGE